MPYQCDTPGHENVAAVTLVTSLSSGGTLAACQECTPSMLLTIGTTAAAEQGPEALQLALGAQAALIDTSGGGGSAQAAPSAGRAKRGKRVSTPPPEEPEPEPYRVDPHPISD